MSTAARNDSNRLLRRRLLLAALSSASFVTHILASTSNVLSLLVENWEELEGAILGSIAIIAILLFGLCVLVPHIPRTKRRFVPTAGVVTLPLLWLLPANGVAYGISEALQFLLSTSHSVASAVGGGIAAALWVLGAAFSVVLIFKLTKRPHFWRYMVFAAAVCAIPIFFGVYIFFDCFYNSCPQGAISAVFFLIYFVGIVTPVALATALHFGVENQSMQPSASCLAENIERT